ncbi:MAG: hypothetical protein GXP50_13055 [Deltaproteobacteria bacterium]|nr:hypothetical protein [Deltaproteobacteria bacterium]
MRHLLPRPAPGGACVPWIRLCRPAALLVCLCLLAPPSARAADPAVPPELEAAFHQALDQAAGASPLLDAMRQTAQAMEGQTQWTEALLDQIAAIARQTGVAFDELVPSVQGCIRQRDGTPLEGVPVLTFPGKLMNAELGTGVYYAFTKGQATPAMIGAGVVVFPVDEAAWLSERQRRNFGPGCYWVPFPFTPAEDVVNAVWNENSRTIRIIPIVPGYTLNHNVLAIEMIEEDSYTVRELDHALQPWTEGTELNRRP